MYVYALLVCSTDKDRKRASNPLEMTLQVVVSSYVCAENQTWVLCNSSPCC